MTPARALLAAAAAVVLRPSLWATALIELRRFTPDGWWRRRPFLPVPDPALLRFRAVTQYGDPARPPDPHDVVSWLRWCKVENHRRQVR